MWNIPIVTPVLGYLMKLCYMIFNNYGLALIVFSLIVKLLTLPFQIKQQKSTAKMAKFSPKLKQLQKQYANNKQKYQEEMMKLYQEENVNPMGSCLPMLISMVILFGIVGVVYAPLNYISNLEGNTFGLTQVTNQKVTDAEILLTDTIIVADKMDGKSYNELSDEEKNKIFKSSVLKDGATVNKVKLQSQSTDYDKAIENVERVFKEFYPDDKGFAEFLTDTKKISSKLYQRPQLLMFKVSDYEDGKYSGMFDIIDPNIKTELKDVDYTFFGLPLSEMPSWTSIYILIPVLSFIFQLVLTFISQHYQKKNNPGAQSMGMGMNLMLYIMPVFSFYISFSFPVGLGLYWTLSSLYSLIQTVVLNKIYTPEHVEELLAKSDKKKKKTGFYQRALLAQQEMNSNGSSAVVVDENGEEKKLSKAEQKALERQRLNEARKRMAEKYGDEYTEDDK